ncbi:ribonucleotide-diphosphate reductase subunit beta [Nocardia concava]|uniref:ribonucleotide-diphosphate reductase subunit beta n=1 Tax=Nocardia concava TaxID=257281 RepID=UPI0005950880|nr:ribonucleotide-diphosphate reductase subunit beta [Nocardia concava]
MNQAAVLDIDHDVTGRVSPIDLYHRWESQHWQIRELGIDGDRTAWHELPPFLRGELLRTLVRFGAGEMAVTETLSPIAYAAPEPDFQVYISTQIADEARHALFFKTYLAALAEEGIVPETRTDEEASGGDLFERSLAEIVDRVRKDPNDLASWYEAVVVYHLLIEGTVAMTGLHTLLRTIRELKGLNALREGLVNVARDESRHVNFGVVALRTAIGSGHSDLIEAAVAKHARAAAFTMVNPTTRDKTPTIVVAMTKRPEQLRAQWDFAALSLRKRLTSAGIVGDRVVELVAMFRGGIADALAAYRERHGVDHPAQDYGAEEAR